MNSEERLLSEIGRHPRETTREVPLATGAWQAIGAVLGRDMLLVGPSPRNPTGEALVLAPPGVRIPTPEDHGAVVSTDGWRVALWPGDAEGRRHVDLGRPTWLTQVSLAYVIGLVEAECPESLPWVAERLERSVRNAHAAQQPDRGGNVFAFTDRWRRDADAMLEELDIALAEPERRMEAMDAVLEGAATAASQDADRPPPAPGRYDERLRPGALRRLYDNLSQMTVAGARNSCTVPTHSRDGDHT